MVKAFMAKTVEEAGFHTLGKIFHQYEPAGVTGIILLSESHMSVHTWPEHNFLAVDIFTCSGDDDPEKALDILSSFIKPRFVEKKVLDRSITKNVLPDK